MPSYTNSSPVFVHRCEDYNESSLYLLIKEAFSQLGIDKCTFERKKVLLKPNLVLAKSPDHGATTHPAFAKAAAKVVRELGAADVVLADSPGGPYNETALSVTYNVCGMKQAARDGDFRLNDNFSFSPFYPNMEKLKMLNMIDVYREADVVVDLCRLKTHTLTGMSCAVKNLYGLIPGVEKFQMHSNFPRIDDFSEMLVDLASYVTANKTFVAICDAVVSMEGNGPSYGTPKKTGLMLVSRSPFALDVIGERIIYGAKSDDTANIKHLDAAARRGIMPRRWQDIEIVGDIDYPVYDFKIPDSGAGSFLRNLPNIMGGRLAELFSARPLINTKKCVGCGKCAESCPRKTIKILETHGRKLAQIDKTNCIRCYCCQELCPIGAVDTKQNILIKLIH